MATERNGYCPDIPYSIGQMPIGEIPGRTQAERPKLYDVRTKVAPRVKGLLRPDLKVVSDSIIVGVRADGTKFHSPVIRSGY